MHNLAGRDPEQDKNRGDSPKIMRRERNLREKTYPCCLAPSDQLRLKHEESEDPTLIKPQKKVSNMFQRQVLQNISRTSDVSLPLLHMFPVNQALWEILINSCMWATVYLRKDDEEFKRVIDNMEVREVETIFEKVQRRSATSKIVITKSTDSKNRWIGQVVLGEINRCWIAELLLNLTSKAYVVSDSVLRVGGKMSRTSRGSKNLGKRASENPSKHHDIT